MSTQPLSHNPAWPGAPTKVTVIITTYDHERFIKETMDSVLMQETSFDYDVVIIEDCSTDRTRDIVTAYQQAHPRKIRLVLSEVNKCDNSEFMKAIQSSPSPYVAILDGDDYWTCRHKLQKQADYLDQHPECTICFHNVRILYDDGSQEPRNSLSPDQKEISTIEDLMESCFITTCSTMFRRGGFGEFPSWYTSDKCPDWSLFILAAQHGKIGYINEVMAVYRQHAGGFWTGQGSVEQLERVIQFHENIHGYLPAEYTGRIKTTLARNWYELALEHEQAGNRDAAQCCFRKCLGVEPDTRKIKWWLRVEEGSAAQLVFPADDPDVLRIAIEKAATKTSFDIQLNQPHLKIKANQGYSIHFRARADRPRSLVVGVAQAHEPWTGLGLYKRIELTSEWQKSEEEFVAAADEDNARIHFDVGDSDVSMELTSVSLRSLQDGESIEPYLMGKEPLVSVIIIFLNGEKFIREAIESVFAQTYGNWELLLVDDGSIDGSTGIARQYADQYPGKVRYLEHEGHQNRGMSATRNLGVRHANGEYIAFLDADDMWLPHKLKRQVAILESQPRAAMVYGASQYWYSWTGNAEDLQRDHVPGLGVSADTLFEPPTLLTLLYPLGQATAPPPSDILMRSKMFERVSGFEEAFVKEYQLYEDQAFLAKVYLNESVFVADEYWDRYRIHPDSCMAVVAQAGKSDSARLFFLKWLEAYLSQKGVKDAQVWNALAIALWQPYRVQIAADRIQGGDIRDINWQLRVAGGNAARLVFPPNDPDGVRVAIEKAETKAGFDIQLNQPRLKIRANHHYRVQFQARADHPRSFFVGVAQAHEPWTGLGLYKRIELTSEWQSSEEEFVAAADEDNARIHFDMGDSDVPVELASVSLRSLQDGEWIEASLNKRDREPFNKGQQMNEKRDPGSAVLKDEKFGALRRVTPFSQDWGWDRGLPIDRYYIERFLASHAEDIQGWVLEIGDDTYIRKFGGNRVTATDILHVSEGNPRATIVADLTCADHIPSNTFDNIILTQTLHLIYDARVAIGTMHRVLKPGGVLLATFPGITRISHKEWEWPGSWYWGFTSASARRMFGEVFSIEGVQVGTYGNVLTATSFLYGLATEELRQEELDHYDPDYEVLITVRAVKSKASR